MEQNGKKLSVGEMLKQLADKRREDERAKDEARKLAWSGNRVESESVSANPTNQSEVSTELSKASPKELSGAEERFLTSAEAAKVLGYSEKSFRNKVSEGKIPHYRLFGQNRFKLSELICLIKKVDLSSK
jgi:excisionase family DNA binding protein